MSEKRLSETMSDTTYAVSQAQETLNDAITKAINTHFEAGIQVEQKRIIKLLESKLCWCVGKPLNEENGKEELMKHMNCDWEAMMIEYHVTLIKGEQK